MEFGISAEFPPNLAHRCFASLRAIFSLHCGGRSPQNGAIRDPCGGRGAGCALAPVVSHRPCKLHPCSTVGGTLHAPLPP